MESGRRETALAKGLSKALHHYVAGIEHLLAKHGTGDAMRQAAWVTTAQVALQKAVAAGVDLERLLKNAQADRTGVPGPGDGGGDDAAGVPAPDR